MERKPEVPASNRDEALFHFVKPSGVPRGPSNSSVKKETEGSRRYFTLRQTVSGKARLCEVRDASARPGGISMAPKRLRCLRQAGQRSDPQKSVLGVCQRVSSHTFGSSSSCCLPLELLLCLSSPPHHPLATIREGKDLSVVA